MAHEPPPSVRRDGKPPSDVSAVVLAAGAGSRFGGGKLLAELKDVPLIEHVLGTLEPSPVDEVLVVVGDDAERLHKVCESYGARMIENSDWEQGQSTSVRTGLRALGLGVRAAVVLLGDQPLAGLSVGPLVSAFEEGAKVAVATYGGKMRNPVLFAREVWPLLLGELSGDVGAKPFLMRHPELVVGVPCDGVGDPVDVDTIEDLRRLERVWTGT